MAIAAMSGAKDSSFIAFNTGFFSGKSEQMRGCLYPGMFSGRMAPETGAYLMGQSTSLHLNMRDNLGRLGS